MADLTTVDGTYIPNKIREVKSRLWKTTLHFPCQQKPSKRDIKEWQYFLDLISYNGRLHIPLGEWERKPDQIFPFMVNETSDIIYKHTDKWWIVFGRKKRSSKRFVQLHMTVSSIPANCKPVTVIEGSSYLILMGTDTPTNAVGMTVLRRIMTNHT